MKTLPFMLGAALFILPACTAVDSTAARTELAELKETTAQAKGTATAELDAAKASGDAAGAEKAAKTLAAIAEAEKRLAQLEKVLAASTDAQGSPDLGGAIGAAGAFLPPPWNVIALVGGPLLGLGIGEIRRRQARADAVSMVNGLEAAKASNPGLRTALKASETIIKKEYTPGAVALVKANKLASE